MQKGIYPSLPQITQKDVESVITPKTATKADPMANQKNPDGTWKQIAKPGGWSGSGGTSAKEQELQNKAVEAQKKTAAQNAGRTQFGYQETGGAQSQAYQGKVPGSTYDKTKPGTYTNWTESGGAQGQAGSAPSTGNEGIDMLLGKGKYTGVYNNLNRPSDTIILEKIVESANLPNSANVMYNEADKKNTGSLAGFNALSASGDSTAQDNQKNPDGTWKQVAAPGTWSGSGGTTTNDRALLEKAKTTQDMTRRINERRTQFGWKETGGAQGQAISSQKDAAKTIEKPKRVGGYISEEEYNTQYGVLSRQLESSGKFIDEFAKMLQLYQGNMDPEAVRKYELAQAGYNRNLKLQSELQKMKDTLQSNRKLSSKVEEAEHITYAEEVDAAAAFYSSGAMADTKKNKIEHTCIIVPTYAPIRDENGNITYQKRYTIDSTFVGDYHFIGIPALARIAYLRSQGIVFSIAHTHPQVSGQVDENFFGLFTHFGDIIGDYTLNWSLIVKNVYMANERSNNIYVSNFFGPEMEDGKYKRVGRFKK